LESTFVDLLMPRIQSLSDMARRRSVNGACAYLSVMEFVSIRGPAMYLLEVIGCEVLVLLRLEGDPEDTRFWHAVDHVVDNFRDRDNVMIVVSFDDGTPTKAFPEAEVVEFAVPRN
jgi:hypothetical protein